MSSVTIKDSAPTTPSGLPVPSECTIEEAMGRPVVRLDRLVIAVSAESPGAPRSLRLVLMGPQAPSAYEVVIEDLPAAEGILQSFILNMVGAWGGPYKNEDWKLEAQHLRLAVGLAERLKHLHEHMSRHGEEDAKLGAAFDAWLAAPGPETTPKLYEAIGEWRLAGRGEPRTKGSEG